MDLSLNPLSKAQDHAAPIDERPAAPELDENAQADLRSSGSSYVVILRHEALSVKACATDMLFKGLTFSAALLGLSAAALYNFPAVALVAIPISYLLGAVARIILHKYATANRILGYELHLARSSAIDTATADQNAACGDAAEQPPTAQHGTERWLPWMRDEISWEEALKAWRVVQATCFERLYEPPNRTKSRYWNHINFRDHPGYKMRNEYKAFVNNWVGKNVPERASNALAQPEFSSLPTDPEHLQPLFKEGYPWWDTRSLATVGGGVYHSGGYLENVYTFLNRMQMASLVLIAFGALQYARKANERGWRFPGTIRELFALPISWELVFAGMFLFILYWRCCRVLRLAREVNRRREILENGLLSIESCAIMWQAVILAHHRAMRVGGRIELRGYTTRLANQAQELAADITSIHRWVCGQPAGREEQGSGVAAVPAVKVQAGAAKELLKARKQSE